MNATTWFATTPKGMSDLLAAEMKVLGATAVSESRAGVQFNGSLEVAYRACLWSRLANRILMPIAEFPVESADTLYEQTRQLDWQSHLSAEQTIAVDANVSSSEINHSHFAALRIKDAIADNFVAATGIRPSVDLDKPDVRINCYIHRNRASLALDLAGTSLHQRNYRLAAGRAPLKENLAAAILLRAQWQDIAGQGGGFVDLMCGSGTLPIEAAMIAADIAPGLGREYFGFLGWRQHDAKLWERLQNEAKSRRQAGLKRLPTIMGFDNSRRTLAIARENAIRAGLGDNISFKFQDLFGFRHSFPATGLMATNPPYGRRMLETGELPALYQALGRVLKENMVGWKAAVFTEDQQLGKSVGIRAGKIHTLYNGAVMCKLLHFDVTPDNFFADPRLPRRLDPEQLSEQAAMFRNRLEKNQKQLKRWANREGISCYRLYDADLPDYSAAIDVYYSAERIDERWVCIQEYAPPKTVDEQRAKFRTQELVTVAQHLMEVDDDHLFYKLRARQRGEKQYERASGRGQFHTVAEGPCRLLVNFEDYLDTGLFLDHRPMRLRIGAEAAGKSILNLFAYTAAVTVHAAVGGASETVSVDMSRTYLDWARRNLALNGLDNNKNRLIQADCMVWLTQQSGAHYDIIFLDPPTFSNSKRMERAMDVQTDHADLIEAAIKLLKPEGKLYFSTNSRSFKLDPALEQDYRINDISAITIPQDFKRRQNIHRCWEISFRD